VLDADAITHANATGLEALVDLKKDLRRGDIVRLRMRIETQFEAVTVCQRGRR